MVPKLSLEVLLMAKESIAEPPIRITADFLYLHLLLSPLSIVDRPSANTFQYLVVAIKVVASFSSSFFPSFLCCYMAAWINANITANQRAAG